MLNKVINGFTIVAHNIAPLWTNGGYTILGMRTQPNGYEYVVAHVRYITPEEGERHEGWPQGHYFTNFTDAVNFYREY